MPAAADHALLALSALIDELDSVGPHGPRSGHVEVSARVEHARSEALARLEAADRLDLFEAASQALAAACARRGLPQPARAAAYSALIGLIASDLVSPATFHTLYASWEETLGGHGDSPSILRGEEVLFHIG
jgi:hypothetical protein